MCTVPKAPDRMSEEGWEEERAEQKYVTMSRITRITRGDELLKKHFDPTPWTTSRLNLVNLPGHICCGILTKDQQFVKRVNILT